MAHTPHQHGNHDHTDIDWGEMAPELEAQAELFTSLYERAMAWLADKQTEPGLIVDAGSGPGVVACLLDEAFPGARVVHPKTERRVKYSAGSRLPPIARP